MQPLWGRVQHRNTASRSFGIQCIPLVRPTDISKAIRVYGQWPKSTAGIEAAPKLRCDSVTTKSTGKVISWFNLYSRFESQNHSACALSVTESAAQIFRNLYPSCARGSFSGCPNWGHVRMFINNAWSGLLICPICIGANRWPFKGENTVTSKELPYILQ